MECFKVTRKGSVLTPNHGVLKPGKVLTREQCDQLRLPLDEHLGSGYMVRMNEQTDPQEVAEMLPTGVSKQPVIKHESETPVLSVSKDEAPPKQIPPTKPEPISETTAPESESPWKVDPSALAEATLDQMNSYIKQIDPNGPQFETTEEAGAWLTQDWQPTQSTERGTSSPDASPAENEDVQVATD